MYYYIDLKSFSRTQLLDLAQTWQPSAHSPCSYPKISTALERISQIHLLVFASLCSCNGVFESSLFWRCSQSSVWNCHSLQNCLFICHCLRFHTMIFKLFKLQCTHTQTHTVTYIHSVLHTHVTLLHCNSSYMFW